MSKQAISVTLELENLTWLRGRVRATGGRSISELLDQLVSSARRHGHGRPKRSVMGAIEIDPADPNLAGADAAIRSLFDASLARPLVIHESSPRFAAAASRKKKTRA